MGRPAPSRQTIPQSIDRMMTRSGKTTDNGHNEDSADSLAIESLVAPELPLTDPSPATTPHIKSENIDPPNRYPKRKRNVSRRFQEALASSNSSLPRRIKPVRSRAVKVEPHDSDAPHNSSYKELPKEPEPQSLASMQFQSRRIRTAPRSESAFGLKNIVGKVKPKDAKRYSLDNIIPKRPSKTPRLSAEAKNFEDFHDALRASFPPMIVGPDFIQHGPLKKRNFTIYDVVGDWPREPAFSIEYAVEQYNLQQSHREHSAIGQASEIDGGVATSSSLSEISSDTNDTKARKVL